MALATVATRVPGLLVPGVGAGSRVAGSLAVGIAA